MVNMTESLTNLGLWGGIKSVGFISESGYRIRPESDAIRIVRDRLFMIMNTNDN